MKLYGIVNKEVVENPNISLRSKGLYAYLSTFINSKTRECYVGIDKMCNDCGITQSTAHRCLRELEKHGAISRYSRGKKITKKTILK